MCITYFRYIQVVMRFKRSTTCMQCICIMYVCILLAAASVIHFSWLHFWTHSRKDWPHGKWWWKLGAIDFTTQSRRAAGSSARFSSSLFGISLRIVFCGCRRQGEKKKKKKFWVSKTAWKHEFFVLHQASHWLTKS